MVNRKRDIPLGGQDRERAFERAEEPANVDLTHVELTAACLEAADVEQSLDEARQRVRLFTDRLEDFLLLRRKLAVNPFLQEIQVADDDVDRGLQLVRRHAHELRAQPLELGKLTRHGLVARGESAELGLFILRQAGLMAQISFGDCVHAALELVNRPADGSEEPDRNGQCIGCIRRFGRLR